MAYTDMTITSVSGGSITAADTDLTLSGNVTVNHLGAYDERTVTVQASSNGGTTWSNVGSFTLPAWDPTGNGNGTASQAWSGTISGLPAAFANVNDANYVFRAEMPSERNATGTLTSSTSAAIPVDTTADAGTATTVAFADPLVNATEATGTSYTVSGLDADATAAVTFTSSGGGSPVVANVAGNGTQTVNLSGLADGTISTSIAITDDAGAGISDGSNTTTRSGGATTLDKTAPTETTTVRLSSDTGASSTDGVTSSPALSGTDSNGLSGQTVTIKDGNTVVGTATTGVNGAWTFANGSATEGSHSYTAAVTDAAGNSGGSTATSPASVTLDKTAPTETTTVRLSSDTGAPGDGITANAALAGTVSSLAAGVAVTVYDNGAAVGTAVTGANGAWSFTPAGDFVVDPAHTYTASVTDAAGNHGPVASTTPAVTQVDVVADTDVVVDLTDATVLPGNGGAGVDFAISGLDAGSSAAVTFTGSGGGSVTRTFSVNGEQTANVSGLSGDVTATVLVTDKAGNVAVGQGDTLQADPVCFMPGTLVATPSGERRVETLAAGDLVLTTDGGAAPVRWLGRQTVSTRFADPLRVLPIRITAGALGENLPVRDLLLSPDHALLVDGVLVQAGALVNGTTIRREAAVPEVFTYWHVELADHALVLAEGVPAETFIDNVARLAFDNWDEHEAAGSEAPIAEMALPRAKAARQVPAATRRRLADRAALLLGKQAAAAAA